MEERQRRFTSVQQLVEVRFRQKRGRGWRWRRGSRRCYRGCQSDLCFYLRLVLETRRTHGRLLYLEDENGPN